MILTADAVGGKHTYLAAARPDCCRSMATIRNHGGPWRCTACGTASLLLYRCSACGRDLTGDHTTHGRQG